MRYDTPVSFILERGEFDDSTGNTNTVIAEKTVMLANVSDTAARMSDLLYGKIKVGAYTVIIQNAVPHPFDYILIDGKRYTVDKARDLRRTTTYFVSGGV